MIGNADLVALFYGASVKINSRGMGNCDTLQNTAFDNVEVEKLFSKKQKSAGLPGEGRAMKAARDGDHSDIYDVLVKNMIS